MDFERLSHQHKDAVYRQMVRVCGNREDAEDVLIEALMKAYRSLGDLSAPEAFRTWLGRIASRVCWQLRQREALLPLLQLSAMEATGAELPDFAPSAEEQVARAQMKQLFEQAMSSLPENYRAVYQLRAVEECSGEQAAERLGISLTAMKSRWHRSRVLMRKRLDAALAGNTRQRKTGEPESR